MTDARYDVVIVEIKTRIVKEVVGENLLYEVLWKRLISILHDANPHYMVKVVEAGKFKKGDKIP